MIAIDTNVLVRLLTKDDAAQAEIATSLFDQNDIFISKTVLLETEWVLRYAYQLNRADILESFKKLLGLPNVAVETPTTIRQAIGWFEFGVDFADAIHVASSQTHIRFATFDKKLATKLEPISNVTIQLL